MGCGHRCVASREYKGVTSGCHRAQEMSPRHPKLIRLFLWSEPLITFMSWPLGTAAGSGGRGIKNKLRTHRHTARPFNTRPTSAQLCHTIYPFNICATSANGCGTKLTTRPPQTFSLASVTGHGGNPASNSEQIDDQQKRWHISPDHRNL